MHADVQKLTIKNLNAMIKSLQLAIVCWLLMTAQAASAQIDLNFSTVSPACHGTSNGSATVITAGGIAPLTYQWDNGQTTQTNQGIGAGTYEVTVTDAANMTASGTVTVFEPNQLTLEIVVTNIPCATDPLGGAVNAVILGGTLPYSIVWNDGDTDVSRQNLPAGNYAATVTDGNGCTASDEGTIQIPPPLEVVAVAISPSCGGANNGSATVVPSGGTGPYTHTWTPGGYTGSTVTGLAPGQYYVCTFDANHCQKDLWVIIPEITGLNVNLSVLSAACTGIDNGVVTAFVDPPGNYVYNWNLPPFTGVNQLTGLPADIVVSVTVTDPVSGCTGSATTTVSAHSSIDVIVTDTDIPCAGENIGQASANAFGGVPDYTYVWLLPPSGPVIGNGPNINGLAPGAYMVSVTDSQGCTAIGVADIGVESAPDAIIGGPTVVECGDSLSILQFVNLSVDPFDSIATWNWTITTATDTFHFGNVSPLELALPVGDSGTVQLVVTSLNGCTDTATQHFVVPGIPDISLSTGAMAMVCGNGSVDIVVNGGHPWYSYVWSPLTGLTLDSIPPNATANPSVTTTYQLIASDQGCSDTVSVIIVRKPLVEIGVDTNLIETCDSLVVLNAHANVSKIFWVDSIGTFLGFNPITVVAGAPATYTAIAMDSLGCMDSVSVTVIGHPHITLTTDAMMMDCHNDPVHIVVNGGSPSFTYVWSPMTGLTLDTPAPNVIADPDTTTTYQLIASNDEGCSDTVYVTVIRVIPIELTIDTNLIVTCDSLVVLNAHSNVDKVFWIDGQGNVLGNNPITVVAGDTMEYTAIAMDTTGCMDSISVVVIGLPDIHLSTDSTLFDCDNGPVHIVVNGAEPGYTYVWSPMTGLTLDGTPPNAIANPDSTTTYQLIGSSGSGCADTVTVTVVRVVPIELTVDTNLIVTCDSLVVLNAHSNVDKVFWIDAQGNVLGNNPITVVAGDTAEYTAVAMDTTGCMDSISVVVIGLPNIHITTDSILLDCDNGPVHIVVNGADPGYTYVWSPMTGLTLDAVPPNATADPDSTTTYQLIASSGSGCADTVTVTVIRVVPIELSVEHEVIVTCDSTVVLQATSNVADVCWIDSNGTVIGGGANPVTVVVQHGVTVVYTAIAKDTTGCRDSLSVSVTGHGVDIDIDPENMGMGCAGEDITLGVINNHPNDTLHYQWTVTPPLTITSSDTTASITVAGPAGMYTVTVTATNQYGCSQTLQIPVKISDRDTLDAGDISLDLCDGRKISFFNNSGYDGVWTFGDGDTSLVANPMHMYDTAGVYVVTFTPLNAICVLPWDSTITVLQEGLAMPVITNDYVICVDSAQIQFHGTSNNPNVTWAWTFENGTPPTSTLQNPLVSFQAEDTITATLKVTDINGCMADTSQEVIIQFIDDFIQDTLMFCIDTTVQLNADGFDTTATYSWTAIPFDSTLVSTDKNPTVSPDVVTVYTVTITQGLLCSTTYQVTVIPLEAADLQLQPDTTVCNNTPLSITASGNGLGYEWSESPLFDTVFANVPTVLITPVRNGIYYVRTSSIAGCVAVDSIKINNGSVAIQPEPFDGNICAGEETGLLVVNLIGGDTLTYVWTPALPGTPGQTVTPTESTNYQVVVTNQFGCKDTLDFQVNVSTISVDATVTGPSVIHQGESTTLLATPSGTGVVVSYEWSPAGGLSDPNIPNPTASPNQDQVYEVTVTTADGCTATDTVQIRVIPNQCIEPYIFVPTAFTPNNDSNNDFFIVRGDNITELYFVVWDRWGEKVYETTDINAKGWDGSFKGNELTPDAFAWYIRARCENGAVYEKKGDVTLMK